MQGYGHYVLSGQTTNEPLEEMLGKLIKMNPSAASELLERRGLYIMPMSLTEGWCQKCSCTCLASYLTFLFNLSSYPWWTTRTRGKKQQEKTILSFLVTDNWKMDSEMSNWFSLSHFYFYFFYPKLRRLPVQDYSWRNEVQFIFVPHILCLIEWMQHLLDRWRIRDENLLFFYSHN